MDIRTLQIINHVEDKVSVQWQVMDGDWSYMDTYVYSREDYNALTSEQLRERQTAQYLSWREYCENPTG